MKCGAEPTGTGAGGELHGVTTRGVWLPEAPGLTTGAAMGLASAARLAK